MFIPDTHCLFEKKVGQVLASPWLRCAQGLGHGSGLCTRFRSMYSCERLDSKVYAFMSKAELLEWLQAIANVTTDIHVVCEYGYKTGAHLGSNRRPSLPVSDIPSSDLFIVLTWISDKIRIIYNYIPQIFCTFLFSEEQSSRVYPSK